MKTTNLFTVTGSAHRPGSDHRRGEDIRIAVVGPMTGSSAAIGEDCAAAAEKAVADLNGRPAACWERD